MRIFASKTNILDDIILSLLSVCETHASLTEEDKTSLKKLLFEKEAETLSGLADLKQDTKDFKARMISAERDKMLLIKPLYLAPFYGPCHQPPLL